MKFTKCNNCGNEDTNYEVLQCEKCNKILGCFKEPGFMTFSAQGCSGVKKIFDHCPSCGHDGGWGNPYNRFKIIKKD